MAEVSGTGWTSKFMHDQHGRKWSEPPKNIRNSTRFGCGLVLSIVPQVSSWPVSPPVHSESVAVAPTAQLPDVPPLLSQPPWPPPPLKRPKPQGPKLRREGHLKRAETKEKGNKYRCCIMLLYVWCVDWTTMNCLSIQKTCISSPKLQGPRTHACRIFRSGPGRHPTVWIADKSHTAQHHPHRYSNIIYLGEVQNSRKTRAKNKLGPFQCGPAPNPGAKPPPGGPHTFVAAAAASALAAAAKALANLEALGEVL